jgi:hypothetical protein
MGCGHHTVRLCQCWSKSEPFRGQRNPVVIATVYGSVGGEDSIARCSAGLCQLRISRGRRLSSAATAVRCSGLWRGRRPVRPLRSETAIHCEIQASTPVQGLIDGLRHNVHFRLSGKIRAQTSCANAAIIVSIAVPIGPSCPDLRSRTGNPRPFLGCPQ